LLKRSATSAKLVITWRDFFLLIAIFFSVISRAFRFLFRLISSRPVAVLITGTGNLIWEQMGYILCARLLGIKAFLHYHGPFYLFWRRSSIWKKKMIAFIYRRLSGLFLLSQMDRNHALDFMPAGRVFVVPNGISSAAFSFEYQERLSVRDNVTRVIFLGGVHPSRKGSTELLAAVDNLTMRGCRAEYYLSGSEEIRLALTAKSDQVKEQLKYVGWITEEDKMRYFRQSDIMVLPSYDEGLPYVLIEAMASGMAVVSTKIGGIPDLVPSELYGLLVEAGDVEALTAALQKMISDREYRYKVGRESIKRIKSEYVQEVIFANLASRIHGVAS